MLNIKVYTIRIIFLLFWCFSHSALYAGEEISIDMQSSSDIVLKLDSSVRYEREQAINALKNMDPIATLEQFKRNYSDLLYESQTAFNQQVFPFLKGDKVDLFLLEEFRAGIENHEKFEKLAAQVEKDEQNFELIKTAEKHYKTDKWWSWIIRSRSNLDFITSYDELYGCLLKCSDRGFPLREFARVLNEREPERSINDFTSLLSQEDKQMKLRGIWSLEAIKYVPEHEILKKYYRSDDIGFLDDSDQYIMVFGRNDLELLFFLLDNPSKRVNSMADYQLGRLANLNPEEKKEIFADKETPQEKLVIWKQWWEEHKDDSEQSLRNQTVARLIEKAENGLTKEILNQLYNFSDNNDIYKVYEKALLSDDTEIKNAALDRLYVLAIDKNSKTSIEIIINFIEKQPIDEATKYAGYLPRINDERARVILLEILNNHRGEDTMWMRGIARSLGLIGQDWALDPLVDMIIMDGSGLASNAAQEISNIKDCQRAIPRLCDALLKEQDHNKRSAITKAIVNTGGVTGFAEMLTDMLKKIPDRSDSIFKGGIRYDVLSLMETFPDPNAKSMLSELLKSNDPWDVLGAARVLGRLGDDSGIDILISYIEPTRTLSATFYNHHIGAALKQLNSSKTKKLLEEHFEKGDLKVKELTINIMAQQADPIYISFFEQQLKSSNSELAFASSRAISQLIYEKDNAEEKARNNDFNIERLKEEDLIPVKTMLLWAFFDTKIFENHKSFPDHSGLTDLKGAVLRVNRFQQIEFDKESKSLMLTTPGSQSVLMTSDGHKAGKQEPYAGGSVERMLLGDYMTVFLRLNYGGASCLFKRNADKWEVIDYVGGIIE